MQQYGIPTNKTKYAGAYKCNLPFETRREYFIEANIPLKLFIYTYVVSSNQKALNGYM